MDQFKEEELPDNIPALYYSYHIMVGLGTIFIGVMALAAFLFMAKKIVYINHFVWTIMFLVPFPYIANITGWYVAELGRQPYLVYGLLKTSDRYFSNSFIREYLIYFTGFCWIVYACLGCYF